MLPLITNTLPQVSASQPSGLAASLASATGATTAAQQITAVAVPGTGAASPYLTQTPQQRSATSTTRSPTQQPDRAAILPDPEFWKVPTREAMAPAPMQARAPIQVNLPQVSQFTAQVIAQQPMQTQAAMEEEPAPPVRRETSGVPAKKTGVGEARGTDAYAVATQRLSAISFPPTLEEIS